MSCLFVHDFRSYKRNNVVYTTNLSYEILMKRYARIFGKVNVINRSGRMNKLDDASNYVKASGVGVNFVDEIDIFSPIDFLIHYKNIKKIVHKNILDNDYIIIRLDSFLGLIAARFCRKQKKKYLIEVAGCVWDSFWNKGVFGKIIAYPLYKIMQYEIECCPYVVYVTSEFLQKRYPTKGMNINISNVQLGKVENEVLEKRLSHIENRKKADIYNIVTVASVEVRYKGQEMVIKALATLKSMGMENFRYHLIGGGDNSFLKCLAEKYDVSKQVVFHGNVNHEKVINFLDECDIYIQPSKQEGLPRALIEGMSRGLLCYGTKIAGIPELLQSQMLIHKGKKGCKELVELLKQVDKKLLLEQAVVNHHKVKLYEEDRLEKRRENFFKMFIEQKSGETKLK